MNKIIYLIILLAFSSGCASIAESFHYNYSSASVLCNEDKYLDRYHGDFKLCVSSIQREKELKAYEYSHYRNPFSNPNNINCTTQYLGNYSYTNCY